MLTTAISKLKSNQLFKDSFWSLLGNVVGRGLSLVAGIAIARFLGKDIYGEYGIIRNTILTIGVFSTFGLGYTATKYIAEFRQTAKDKIPLFLKYANKITLLFSGAMAVLLFAFADVVAAQWLEAAHLATPLRILSVLIVFNAITTTQIGILSGFGRFKEIAKINTWVGVLTFLLSVVLTYSFALNGALIALLLVQILNCVFNYTVVKKCIPASLQAIEDNTLQKEIIRFSTPIALREAVYSITSWMLGLFIIRFSSFGELGLYTAAMQWNAIVLFIPGVLKNVVLTHLSKNSSDNVEHKSVLKQVLLITSISVLIPIALVFLFSGFIESMYGKTFSKLGGLISIAVFTTFFSATSGVYVNSFISLNKNWIMLYSSIIREIGIFLLGFAFISNQVFDGAKSIIIASLIMNILFLCFAYLIYINIRKI